MRQFEGKVAVITGAASGIGRAFAERCAHERMKLVLADVEEGALAVAGDALRAGGAELVAVPTDVSKEQDVSALAKRCMEAFGAVHLLFNNAGVSTGGLVWEHSLADWQWVLGVNLWGVIHGVRTFVPLMLAQQAEAHIVNTASMAGLLSGPGNSIYTVSKHGVVTLSESLYHELRLAKSKIGVSVLCPGFVRTRILHAERNRPAGLRGEPNVPVVRTPEWAAIEQQLRAAIEAGLKPEQIARQVFQAIRKKQLYVVTHPQYLPAIRQRSRDILAQRNPELPPFVEDPRRSAGKRPGQVRRKSRAPRAVARRG